jgi:hypothetical protein
MISREGRQWKEWVLVAGGALQTDIQICDEHEYEEVCQNIFGIIL